MHISSPSGQVIAQQPARRTRRLSCWLGRALVGLLALIAALSLAGAIYPASATQRDRRAYPPPGRLIDVNGYTMHISCAGTPGSGNPTVVLENGLAGPVSTWVWVQQEIARTTQVCAYDRAGSGWSDWNPAPRDGLHVAAELHALLGKAGIAGPYV